MTMAEPQQSKALSLFCMCGHTVDAHIFVTLFMDGDEEKVRYVYTCQSKERGFRITTPCDCKNFTSLSEPVTPDEASGGG